MRLEAGLPNLRDDANRQAIMSAISAGSARFGFHLNQFSLQSNHIHLIAEASDRRALSRGMQGLLVRVSRALNRLWRRRGPVFADRYHVRELRTPRDVRAALVYVLHNAKHHGLRFAGIDPCSSGRWFDGWRTKIEASGASPIAAARTWLLREGWRRHGRIDFAEEPSPGRRPRGLAAAGAG